MQNIHNSFKELFEKYEIEIDGLYEEKTPTYPKKEDVFKVFEMDVMDIKVVLLGQDPYHGPNQANGLSFSVNDKIKIPPSLLNIFKELKRTYPERNYDFKHGNLNRWFYEEKIFLLNSSLTVKQSNPGSHMDLWVNFTDDVITFISDKNKNCIFLLLGKFAQSKDIFILNKENIVSAPHPSPMAKGFIGSNVFKKIDKKLNYEIDWKI
jgi:uracil-DNA glycosylase